MMGIIQDIIGDSVLIFVTQTTGPVYNSLNPLARNQNTKRNAHENNINRTHDQAYFYKFVKSITLQH